MPDTPQFACRLYATTWASNSQWKQGLSAPGTFVTVTGLAALVLNVLEMLP